MADSVVDGTFELANRYKNYNTTTDFDPTINRWKEKDEEEKKTEDRGTLSFTDMLGLMVTQFQNQTIDNQASTTDMMNQLVQMSSMQAMTDMVSQIKELTLANVMSYSASLVGKTVTVGVENAETGKIDELVGVVQGTGTYDGQQVVYLDNGKGYFLKEIMAVGTLPAKTEDPDESGDVSDKVEQTPDSGTEDTESEENTDAVSGVDTDNEVG